MIWLLLIIPTIFVLFIWLKHIVHTPLIRANLTQFDFPRIPNLTNSLASNAHKDIEFFLKKAEQDNHLLSNKERLIKIRKTMDDGGVRVEIPAKIISINSDQINTSKDLLEKNVQPGVRGEWIISPTVTHPNKARRILYIHGGGFYLGSPKSHRIITNKFSEIANASVFALDYRLRPEHPRLASLDDCKKGYLWLLENGPEGELSSSDIIIAGDSAGGNLCLSLLAWIRDEKLLAPVAAICLSPVTDSTLSSPSVVNNLSTDVMLQSGIKPLLEHSLTTLLIGGWLDNKVKLTDPRISPLFGDLSNLPPTLIQVSDSECLEDDARRYANKAIQAGSPVTLQVSANMMHVWHTFEPELEEAKAAFDEIKTFISQLES